MPPEKPSAMMPMPVPGDEFGQQIFLTLLNKLIDEQHQTNQSLRSVQETLSGILTDMAIMKSTDLERRIDKLEAKEQQRNGAAAFASMIKDWAPWVIALLFGMWIFFNAPKSVP